MNSSDFGLPPTTWTLVFWNKKIFHFVFFFRSRRPKHTSKVSKTISGNSRVLSDKFWINIRLMRLDFKQGNACFQWRKGRWKNSDFGILPTTWTLEFWDKKIFYFVFSLRSGRPKHTSKVSKTISGNRGVLSDKFWINTRLIWLDFDQRNACFQWGKER